MGNKHTVDGNDASTSNGDSNSNGSTGIVGSIINVNSISNGGSKASFSSSGIRFATHRPPLEYFVKCMNRNAALALSDAAVRVGLRVALADENEIKNKNAENNESKSNSEAVYVCVGISRKLLEHRAEQEGLLKWAERPSSFTGHPYRLVFSRESQHTRTNTFEDYSSPDFFSPCERVELLENIVEEMIEKVEGKRGKKKNNNNKDEEEEEEEEVEGGGKCVHGPLYPVGGDIGAGHSLTEKAVLRSAVTRVSDNLRFSLAARDSEHSITQIQAFYGSQVAIYFAWSSLYNAWLLIPAVLGIIAQFDIGSISSIFTKLFFWRDSTTSETIELMRTIHNSNTTRHSPYFALIVVVWAHFFIKAWSRRANFLADEWGHLDDGVGTAATAISSTSSDLVPIRPGFHGTMRKSPITGQPELHYPDWKRLVFWYPLSTIVSLCMFGLAVVASGLLLNLQGAVGVTSPIYVHSIATTLDPIGRDGWQWAVCKFLPITIHVAVIRTMNDAYRVVAEWLTEKENHRTAAAYADSLIGKRFWFVALDYYFALLYVAFVDRDLDKLRGMLVLHFAMDTARRVITETVIPFVSHSWQQKRKQKKAESLALAKISPPESPHPVELGAKETKFVRDQVSRTEEYEPYEDYLESVIQYGYIVLFAGAFSLSALIAVLCNAIEYRADVAKLTWTKRRPRPVKATNIGPWLVILKVLTWLAIPMNVLILGYSSNQLSDPTDVDDGVIVDVNFSGRADVLLASDVWLMVRWEHLLLVVALAVSFGVSDYATSTLDALARDHFERNARQHQCDTSAKPHAE